MAESEAAVLESVREYYGKTLQTSEDLKTSACTSPVKMPPALLRAMRDVPDEVIAKYYGCGSPLPVNIEGLSVLDLGCGSGRDCYVAARLVGPKGSVTGLDMTDEQLAVARAHAEEYTRAKLGYATCNMRFLKGYIEHIAEAGIAPGSIDLAISNCVINLSPDKPRVLREVFAALREGGELYFSDVYSDRRLTQEVRSHQVLYGECIAGALYVRDFESMCRAVGFTDPRPVSWHEIVIGDPALRAVVAPARFFSITYRCYKLARLDPGQEDYGQVAVYRGTVGGEELRFTLDHATSFERGRPVLVSGNTAEMLTATRLAPHFTVTGTRDMHFGPFGARPGLLDSFPWTAQCLPASDAGIASGKSAPASCCGTSSAKPAAPSSCCGPSDKPCDPSACGDKPSDAGAPCAPGSCCGGKPCA